MRSSRRRPLAAVALAVLLVTGCGAQNPPGVAAQVGDDRITDEQVDRLAEALCVLSAGAQEGGGPIPTQHLRRQALQILVDNELAEDIIDPEAVDDEQVDAARQQTQASRDALPERLRGTFDEAVEDFATSQLGLAALGRESLLENGTEEPDDEAAMTEGQRLRIQHARRIGVEVDPRFGSYEQGRLQPSDGSLSVPVSERARASAAGEAAGDLPASLTCSTG